MVNKGMGDIRTSQTIKTRPGPLTEESVLLRLYKLASQKANFQKKKEWAERQRFQAIRHLVDIQREMGNLRKFALEKIGKSPLPVGKAGNPGKKEEAVKQENPPRPERGKKWSRFSLKY